MVAKAKRAPNGRFLKGTAAGPGRPARETEQAYYDAFTRACSPEDLAQVVAKMVGLAKSGDIHAAKLVMQHALPIQARLELLNHVPEELRYRVAGQTASEVNASMLSRLHDAIRRTRDRDRAVGNYPPSKTDYEGPAPNQE